MALKKQQVLFGFILMFSSGMLMAQVVNTATMDTLESTVIGHVGFGGYVDSYYAYNLLRPVNNQTPFLVSSSSHNEVNINLAYVDVRYRSQRVRARFVPGFGTYVNNNYAQESGTLKNIIEGYVGIKPFPKKNIWVDMGVLGSPYTNESAISKDHLMYTRSFAPEYVPYYLSGVKISTPLSQTINLSIYLLNGWQVIEDNNRGKSFGTQLEYRPGKNILFNWNTYVGDERSVLNPDYRMRYFSDVFMIWQAHTKFLVTTCLYAGEQHKLNAPAAQWWQVNVNGRYQFSKTVSLSGRVEYFNDKENTIVQPGNPLPFSASSAGLCLNIKISDNALLRFEQRSFFSNRLIFEDENNDFYRNSALLTSNLTVWF